MSHVLLVNPRRRRATKKRRAVRRKKPTVRRRRNPVRARRKVTRRRRRNPIGGVPSMRNITGKVKTAATGAAGALALDIALAYIPLPAAVQSGIIGKITKGLGAIALGVVAHKVGVKAADANRMAEGALTVQLHGIGKELVGQFAPGVAMSAYLDDGLGFYGSGWNPNAIADNPNSVALGAYLPDANADAFGMGTQSIGSGMEAYWDEEAY